MKVSKALEVWDQDLMGKAHSTRRGYRAHMNKFLKRWSLTHEELFELRRGGLKSEDPRDVQEVERMVRVQMAEMHDAGYAANTCKALAKSVGSFLESQGLPLKLKQRDMPKGYTNGQSLAMKSQIREMWDYVPAMNKARTRALIMLLKDSGIRLSDAAGLDVGDYLEAKKVGQNGDKFAVFKPLETEKTKAPAHIHLGPEAIEAIDAYLEERGAPALEEALILNRFGKRYTANAMGHLFYRLARWMKAKKISAHSLRKFHTTSLQGTGMSDSWIKVLQGKTIPGSMAAYTRPYESGELTEAYIKGYPRLRVFGQEASAQQMKQQTDEIENLRAEVARLRAGKDTEVEALETRVKEMEERLVVALRNEEKASKLEVGMEAILTRLAKLEAEKNKS